MCIILSVEVQTHVHVWLKTLSPAWISLSGDGPRDFLRHQLSVCISKLCNFSLHYSLPPFFLSFFLCVTWGAKVGREHWDTGQERGETGCLIGDVRPEGTLLDFWQKKKMTDSECLLCWQTWTPRGGWAEIARMAKDVPEWGQKKKQGHANCVTVKTMKGWKGFRVEMRLRHSCLFIMRNEMLNFLFISQTLQKIKLF